MLRHGELDAFIEDLIAGRRADCGRRVQDLLTRGVDVRTVFQALFREALYEIGRRWETGDLSVATEHQATAIVESLLAQVSDGRPPSAPAKHTAVVSASLAEYHQIGARIVADTLELAGWQVQFVGAGASEDALVKVVSTRKPDLLALSVSLEAHLDQLWTLAPRLRPLVRSRRIVVGGQAIAYAPPGAFEAHGCEALSSLEALDVLVRSWPS